MASTAHKEIQISSILNSIVSKMNMLERRETLKKKELRIKRHYIGHLVLVANQDFLYSRV
jgi:hypothetical protein